MARDACTYVLTYGLDIDAQTINTLTMTATDNTCSVEVPLTVPGDVVDTQGFRTEQLGSDPLTIWVRLTGSPVTFELQTPIDV